MSHRLLSLWIPCLYLHLYRLLHLWLRRRPRRLRLLLHLVNINSTEPVPETPVVKPSTELVPETPVMKPSPASPVPASPSSAIHSPASPIPHLRQDSPAKLGRGCRLRKASQKAIDAAESRRLQGNCAWFSSLFQAHSIAAPAAYKAATSDPDTLSIDQAMADANVDDWLKAAQKEISSLEAKNTWTEVPMSEAKTKVLPDTWVFRRKRTPDGAIKKFKARYCVRGDLQEGDFDTFAPVVAWSSVRIFLILSLMTLRWTTCSIDFSNAFVQATLEDPVWIHLPRGFSSKHPGRMCLRLEKSVCTAYRSPHVFGLSTF